MLDTGVVFDGYFCDYNRNFAVTNTSKKLKSCWWQLQEATEAGKDLLFPGNTAKMVFYAMNSILQGDQQEVNSFFEIEYGLSNFKTKDIILYGIVFLFENICFITTIMIKKSI